MSQPVIRAMQADDREAVVHLLGESDPWRTLGYSKDDWNRIFCPTPQGRDCYVALLNGQVAGVAIVKQKFLLGDYLELLGVADWARKEGSRQSAVRAHRRSSSLTGPRTSLPVCRISTNRRDPFTSKHGYQEIGPMPNFLIPGSAELLLRKTAGPARE